MKTPYISVIIPAYNEEKYLDQCLTALKNQQTKYSNEIILVDNNSTDRTPDIGKHHKVKVIQEPRQGRALARQTGAIAARGQILAYTEADCVPSPDWIERIGNYFSNHPHIVGFSGSYRFIHAHPLIEFLGPATLAITSLLYTIFQSNHTFRGTNFALRKSILFQTNGFNQRSVPFDDVELGIRVGKLGPIHFVPTCIVRTSDRRVRGRLLKFFWEFLSSYTRIFFLRQRGQDNLYAPIR